MAKTAKKRNQSNRDTRTQRRSSSRPESGSKRTTRTGRTTTKRSFWQTMYEMEQNLPFDRTNYRLMIATFALMVLGYIFISFSDAVNLMAAHVGVTFVMIATVLGVVAILKTPKHETETEPEIRTDNSETDADTQQ